MLRQPGHYRVPITSDIVDHRWKRGGEVRENPICPRKGVDGASESKEGRGRRRAFLVEGGNHCLQALGIHACRLRESPPPHMRMYVWECEFAAVIVRRRYNSRGRFGM